MTLEDKNKVLIEDNKRLRKELDLYHSKEQTLKENIELCKKVIHENEELKKELRTLLSDAKKNLLPMVKETRIEISKIRRVAQKNAKWSDK